jgi:hypothetical protein
MISPFGGPSRAALVRGLDIFALKPSQYLSQNEIDVANMVRVGTSNIRNQQKLVWPACFVVARAYLDQLERTNGLASEKLSAIRGDLDKADHMGAAEQHSALQKLAKQADGDAKGAQDPDRVRRLAATIKNLATSASARAGIE